MVPKSSTNTIAAIFCRAFILFLEILFHSNPVPTRNRLVLVPSIVDFSHHQRPVGQPSQPGRSNFTRPVKSLQFTVRTSCNQETSQSAALPRPYPSVRPIGT